MTSDVLPIIARLSGALVAIHHKADQALHRINAHEHLELVVVLEDIKAIANQGLSLRVDTPKVQDGVRV